MKLRMFFLLGLGFFVSTAQAELQTYKLDPNHSHVMWHADHFGFSHPSGKWFAEGAVKLDEAKPENSVVNATIPLNKLITGIPKFDAHLKGKDFFDVAQFPTATFTSHKIEVLGKNKAKVEGTLTFHGVSKPIVLDVTLNKLGISPISEKKTAGFTATTMIKRSDFGMKSFLPGVGDDVEVNIEAEAVADPR